MQQELAKELEHLESKYVFVLICKYFGRSSVQMGN